MDPVVRLALMLAAMHDIVDPNLFNTPLHDNHKHQCGECGFVWDHVQSKLTTEEQYHAAHLCPGCGREERHKYLGNRPSNCFFDGEQQINH